MSAVYMAGRLWREGPVMSFAHNPVLLSEVVDLVVPLAPRFIVDCTVGGGGHARALLAACPEAKLLGIDRDLSAVAAASATLAPFGARARVVHGRMSEIEAVLAREGVGPADVLLADLGVSSHQLDAPERGFSFRSEGPLDMRMDQTEGQSALELVTHASEEELAEILRTLGEERLARRVARAIVAHKPTTTGELASVVRAVVRPAADGLDPATRTFQALRLAVNRELEELQALLSALPRVVAAGGLALVISFHSLEDRAVKNAFRQAARDCICPPELPVCRCGHRATFAVLTKKPIVAGDDELRDNPRARSAKLRAAQRLGVQG